MNEFVRRRARVRVRGGAAAAAVVLAGAVLAAPGTALAAAAPADHVCTAYGDDVPWPIKFGLDTDLAASAPAGSALNGNVTTSVDIPAEVAGAMAGFGIVTFSATFRTTVSVGGVDVVTTSPEVSQPVNAGGFSVSARGPLSATAPSAAGPSTILGKRVAVSLKLEDAKGNDPLASMGSLVLDCTSPANLVVDTLDVTPPATKIGTSVAVSPGSFKAGRKGKVAVTVRALSGTAPTGKVTVKVTGKSGTKRVNLTKKVTLTKGKAVLALGTLKKGKLTVVATYAGSARHTKSSARKVIRIS
ncbi:MAG: Ig-like domain repeat protein [Nocardioides sp.]|uniref:Ig-like domain repeat protein n=1 Tax=Nocardioides sp. TaxID=35761 RepID=UPI003F0397E9